MIGEGASVNSLTFQTSKGQIYFDIWDVPGTLETDGFTDGYFFGADCALIMYDAKSEESKENIPKWHKQVRRVCGNIPTAIVCNKKDDDLIMNN